jgi:lipopolysaccharide export system protein LptA
VIAVLFIAVIAGTYFYARMRLRDVLKEIPNKIGIDIKQTANGFQFSKSDGKRTLFTVQAGKLKQFKADGSAELHNVSIVLYGRDSSRFDQIYGDDFSYDKKTGNVTGHGDVQIDLEANPTGKAGPDQGTPRELKNPIHLKTKNLVFNQESGDATTDARVDFSTPQATGWAIGVQYSGKTNMLTLVSQIHMTMGAGRKKEILLATHGIVTHEPHEVLLDHAHLQSQSGTVEAKQATLFLGPDNEVQRVLATGNVNAVSAGEEAEPMRARADEAEMLLTGKQNLLRTATLTGHVHVERIGSQAMQGDAGRAILDFLGQNELQKVHAMDGVRLMRHNAVTSIATASSSPQSSAQSVNASAKPSAPQDYDITAPVIDFFVADGNRLDRAQTSGAAKIIISPSPLQNSTALAAKNSKQSSDQRTVITAGRFDAKFTAAPDGSSRLSTIHGAPDAKIVNFSPGLPDRISTSQTLDAAFLAQGGISSITQQGSVAYDDGQAPKKRTQAWADNALYTPADRILILTGSPRVSVGSMVTTAQTIRIDRVSDDAFADGDVKSTYSELTEQPNGALLASASPIHVTSAKMTAHNSPATALYEGNARLWQDANIVVAPAIEFDRDRRFLAAQGTPAQSVSTVLVQAKLSDPSKPAANKVQSSKVEPSKFPISPERNAKTGKPEEKSADTAPVSITSARLTYADSERKAHYEGAVIAKGTGFTVSSNTMDAYLVPRRQTSSNQSVAGPGQLDHMVAQTNVLVIQPTRRAEGQNLLYTASDDKFVLTGGPPSIFDAERGKITGVSLTFFRGDDRVLVEGKVSTPVVTQTRVAK